MINKVDKGMTSIELMFIIMLIVIFIHPLVNMMFSFTSILFVELIYMLFAIRNDILLRRMVSLNIVLVILIALMYTFFTSGVVVSDTVSNKQLKTFITMFSQYFNIFFPIILFARVDKLATLRQKKVIYFVFLFVYLLVSFSTLKEISENPRIAKMEMGLSEEANGATIGGYIFVISVPFLVVTSVFLLKYVQSRIMSLFFILSTLFFLYFLIKAQYSISFLAALIGLFSAVYLNSNKILRVILLLFFPILLLMIPIMLSSFVDVLDEGDTKLRMQELYVFFTTGDVGEDDLNARFQLYKMAIEAFLEKPIWGNYHLNFNSHSTILEIFASNGILGGIVLFVLFFNSFKYIRYITGFATAFTPLVWTFLFIAFTNPIHSSLPINMAMWFYSPLVYTLFMNGGYNASLVSELDLESYENCTD